MKAIYKYTLHIKEKQEVELPKDALFLRVEEVDGGFYLWAIVETDEEHPKEMVCLEFYKTGQPIETPLQNLIFLGTCKLFIMQELCLYVFKNTLETAKINKI